jgi:hypothetical protein
VCRRKPRTAHYRLELDGYSGRQPNCYFASGFPSALI